MTYYLQSFSDGYAHIRDDAEPLYNSAYIADSEAAAQAIIDQLNLEYLIPQYTAAVQAWLDSTAQANGYDSMATCVSYHYSSVAQWSADASAGIAWRDAVWQAGFAWAEAAQASIPDPIPSIDEFIAQLPQPEDFDWVVHAPGAA